MAAPTPSTYLPGLDLAKMLRDLHERGEHIAAIKEIRTALNCDLYTGCEWYEGLTGWVRPGRRQPARRPNVAGVLDQLAKTLRAKADAHPEAEVWRPLYHVAEAIEEVAAELHTAMGTA